MNNYLYVIAEITKIQSKRFSLFRSKLDRRETAGRFQALQHGTAVQLRVSAYDEVNRPACF